MTNKRWAVLGGMVIVLSIGGLIVFFASRPNDEVLRAALVGKWLAEDPEDPALHRRTASVSLEEAVFQSDGKLNYRVVMKDPGVPVEVEPFGWEVQKGKLILSDRGAGSAGERLAGLRFSVSDGNLLIRCKGRPAKVFKRVDG